MLGQLISPAESLKARLRLVAAVAAIGALGGAVFTVVVYGAAVVQGAFIGAVIGGSWSLAQLSWDVALRRRGFLVELLAKLLIVSFAILFGLNLGVFAFGTGENPVALSPRSLWLYWSAGEWVIDVAFSFGMGAVLSFAVATTTLLGPGTLTRFLLGRYRRPREEQRVVLFLDLAGSTAFAERLGEVRFHALLQEIVADVSGIIVEHRGQIGRYLGDSIDVSWPLAQGCAEARCLRCVLAVQARLGELAEHYRARFGGAPRMRAGLHSGPVAAGEIGTVKKEILYLGDTVNTAARVQEACKQFAQPLLFTDELRRRLTPPAGWRIVAVGPFTPRGRERATTLFTLARAA